MLVEANNLFLADTLGMAIHLQQMYRQGYGFDPRNSYFDSVRGAPDEVMFDVTAHYFTQSIATSFPNAPAGAPQPTIPSFVPDARSLFLGLHYSLARLPEKPMATRPADPRVGYFTTTVADFTDDVARSPRERFVDHWRLEKKDPAAALSEPVKPITYWLDRTHPAEVPRRDHARHPRVEQGLREDRLQERHRRQGAARRRGVRHARRRRHLGALDGQRRADVRRDRADARRSAQRRDPRRRHRHREPVLARPARRRASQVLDLRAAAFDMRRAAAGAGVRAGADGRASAAPPAFGADAQACMAGDYEAEQADYGLDVLAARGELDPDSPEADAFVQAYLTDVTMHEVGHTLGLRHNFRALAAVHRQAAVRPRVHEDARARRLGDGLPADQPAAPGRARAPSRSTPRSGPYDYWAIEYAYKPMPAGATPAQEKAELLKIASRNTEPGLDYGTDEDNFLGVDPASLQGDLGNDPVAFAQKRFAIARDLFARQETRTLQARRGLRGAAPLGRATRCATRCARRACCCASWAASPRCATSPAPAATRCSRCRPRSSARRSTRWSTACSRPTASASRRRCSAASRPTSSSAATSRPAAIRCPPTTRSNR